jgi:hypothetical protein
MLRLLVASLVTLALVSACSGAPEVADSAAPPNVDATADAEAAAGSGPIPTPTPSPTPAEPAVDPATVGANELGEIPVLMYHRILPDGGGEYDRSPEGFRAELEYLCDEGYRPVRTVDLVRGELDIPAGTTPVVLTFDDSTREQLAFTDGGDVDPDTAIGILRDVAAGCDGFEPVASLYVNAGPFGGGHDSDELVRWLHEHGFELGNHTAGHANLAALGPAEVRRELAAGVEVITDVVPDAEVVTLALPLGVWPEDRELAVRGEHDGTTFAHEGILLVGAGPAPSPFHADSDPLAIPRIRSGAWDGEEPDYASGFWLDLFERHPERRYVSDGDPETVSFPAGLAGELDPALAERANPYE